MKKALFAVSPRALALVAVSIAALGCATRSPEAAREDTTKAPSGSVSRVTRGSMAKFASGKDSVSAYFSRPAGPPKAFLVIVPEWWGLVDWPKSVADRFAAQGYASIVPDLYRGKVATDPGLAHELMRGLPEERAIADIRAAAAHVRANHKGLKGGVVGFCMGGGLALRASLDKGPFDAVVVCYGAPVTDPKRLATLPGPVLGIYGKDDRGIGPDQTDAFEKALREAGKAGMVKTYDHAGHAFLNDQNPSAYSPEAAREAWREIDSFLAKHLSSR